MIVDTGILYALADRSDRHHRAARTIFCSRETRIVPEPIVTETAWIILDRLGVDAEIAFLRSLSERSFAIETPTRADRTRAAELVVRYRDAEIGYVDAVTVAIAERLREGRVATLDRRHFSLITPQHVAAFEIVP